MNVVEVLSGLVKARGAPEDIRCDNGPEFISCVVDQWAYWNKVELDFSRLGKPTDNAFIESFNGRLRQECLDNSWFLSQPDARNKFEEWKRDFNEVWPHSALGNLTPREYIFTGREKPDGKTPEVA